MANNKPNDKQRIAIAVAAVAELFGVVMTDAALDLFIASVESLGADSVERAARTAAATCRKMPTPAELRELAGEHRPEDRAARAWDAMCREISRHGSYHHVSFDDPLINATVRHLGGWSALCGKPSDEFEKWTRQEFIRAYQSMLRGGTDEHSVAPLTGLSETRDVHTVATGLPWATQAPYIPCVDDDDSRPRLTLRQP